MPVNVRTQPVRTIILRSIYLQGKQVSARSNVIVLGAGIVGVSTALRLQQHGFDVRIIDRGLFQGSTYQPPRRSSESTSLRQMFHEFLVWS